MYRSAICLLMVLCFCISVQAQNARDRFKDTSSMDIMGQDSNARDCYRAASIAARIHYTSIKEVENCSYALDRGAMSPRDRAATLTNRGIILMALEDYLGAIADFSAALELKPEFGEIHINIGNVYFLDGAYAEAIEQYTAAIDMESTRVYVSYINRGMAHEKLGGFDDAERDYRQAAELLPGAALPQVRLDQLLRKKAESQ